MDPINISPSSTCHVVAMPYPGRGHVNPMIYLCSQLAAKKSDILITFVVTEEWLGLIRNSSDQQIPLPPTLRFCTIPNVIPSEHGRADDFPGFIGAVVTKVEAPFERLLDGLEMPVNAIIADSWLIWMPRVGRRRNISVASFWTMSATVLATFCSFDLLARNGHFPADLSEKGEEIVDYIPGVPSTRLADLPTVFSGVGLKVQNIAEECASMVSEAQYLLFTSVHALEDHVIEALRSKFPFPLYAVGPTIPHFRLDDDDAHGGNVVPAYLEWLDCQPPGSVLYVSMGSFLSVSRTQLEEIVAGVKDSGIRFLWVSRGENASLLKNGNNEMGQVVPWCDQLRVLCHSSVGGFWTHCGWNSTMEAIFAGVPMLTSPIFWDQVPNSKMIVEDFKIGWPVLNKKLGGENLVTRDEIAEKVKRFMDGELDEVKKMRERARRLRGHCVTAIAKGGSSDSNLDTFLREISQG